jgi:Protein of unknown function (DUF1549)
MQRYAIFLVVSIWCFAPAFGIAQGVPQKAVTEGGNKQDPDKKEQAKKTDTLEQLIAEALKNNPDIRVAETKVFAADAEAARTRLKLVSEITSLHADIEAAQAGVNEGKERLNRAKELYRQKVISKEDLAAAELTYVKQRAELASLQAKLPYLLGRPNAKGSADNRRSTLLDMAAGARTDEEFLRRMMLDIDGRLPTPEEMKKFLATPEKDRREKWIDQRLSANREFILNHRNAVAEYNRALAAAFHRADVPETPLTEKLRKALDADTQLDEDTVAPTDALGFVREKALPGVNLVVRAKLNDKPIAIRLREPVPVGAMLQFLEEELAVVFILRDYGIVVVSVGEQLPPGAIRVVDFWKHGAPSKSK